MTQSGIWQGTAMCMLLGPGCRRVAGAVQEQPLHKAQAPAILTMALNKFQIPGGDFVPPPTLNPEPSSP